MIVGVSLLISVIATGSAFLPAFSVILDEAKMVSRAHPDRTAPLIILLRILYIILSPSALCDNVY